MGEAQNWRMPDGWRPPRVRKQLKFKTKDYGYYNHAKAAEIRGFLTIKRFGRAISNLPSSAIRGIGKCHSITTAIETRNFRRLSLPSSIRTSGHKLTISTIYSIRRNGFGGFHRSLRKPQPRI